MNSWIFTADLWLQIISHGEFEGSSDCWCSMCRVVQTVYIKSWHLGWIVLSICWGYPLDVLLHYPLAWSGVKSLLMLRTQYAYLGYWAQCIASYPGLLAPAFVACSTTYVELALWVTSRLCLSSFGEKFGEMQAGSAVNLSSKLHGILGGNLGTRQ